MSNKDKHFKNFVLFLSVIATLGLVISAAYFSVSGLSKTFAGASSEVLIMGSSLELAKVVVSLYLHFFWDKLKGFIKYWLSLFLVVLVIITSMGIYGFLSNAFKETEARFNSTLRKVELIEFKKKNFETKVGQIELQVQQYQSQIDVLNSSKESISVSLQNTSDFYEYIDSETGEKVRRPRSSQNKQILLTQLNSTDDKIESIQERVSGLYNDMEIQRDSIYKLDENIMVENMNNEASSELGPLIYIAELLDKPISRVVNVFMFILVFVFDPLAITLVFATSYAFSYTVQPTNTRSTNVNNTNPGSPSKTVREPKTKTRTVVDSKVIEEYLEELIKNYEDTPEGRLKGMLKQKELDETQSPNIKEEDLKLKSEVEFTDSRNVEEEEEKIPKKNKIKAKAKKK